MTQQVMNALLRFEGKVLRAMLGTVRISDDEYTIMMNYEIANQMNGKTVVNLIRDRKLKWLGHIWRAEEGNKIQHKEMATRKNEEQRKTQVEMDGLSIS